MKYFPALFLAISLSAVTGCDLFSSRQERLERMIIGTWSNSSQEVEFSPDGTYVWRIDQGQVLSGWGNTDQTMVLPGDNMLRNGKWSISEDGRLRMSSERFLGFGMDMAFNLFVFQTKCAGGGSRLLGFMDQGNQILYFTSKRR